MRVTLAAFIIVISLGATVVEGQEIRVMAWSAEQSHANIGTTVAQFVHPDVWAVTRVTDPIVAANMAVMCGCAPGQTEKGSVYEHIEGTSAGGWHSALLFNTLTVKLRRKWEVPELRVGTSAPAPLAAEFELVATGKGILVLACDLNRSHRDRRGAEALLLREWVRRQELPVVIAGTVASPADDVPSEVLGVLREGGLHRVTESATSRGEAVLVGGRGWSSWAAEAPYREDIRRFMQQAERDGELAGPPVAARVQLGPVRTDAEEREALGKEVARLRALVASAPLLDRDEILRQVDALAQALDG